MVNHDGGCYNISNCIAASFQGIPVAGLRHPYTRYASQEAHAMSRRDFTINRNLTNLDGFYAPIEAACGGGAGRVRLR